MAENARRQAVFLAEMQNSFAMGANSHMAVVVFDRHIAFCEEYAEAVSNALTQARKSGTPLDIGALVGIRRKWELWLSQEIEGKLDKFERLVEKPGAEIPFFDHNGNLRSSHDLAVGEVIADLRRIPDTENLTWLRKEAVRQALEKPQSVG